MSDECQHANTTIRVDNEDENSISIEEVCDDCGAIVDSYTVKKGYRD